MATSYIHVHVAIMECIVMKPYINYTCILYIVISPNMYIVCNTYVHACTRVCWANLEGD